MKPAFTLLAALTCAATFFSATPTFAADLKLDTGTPTTLTTEQLLARPDAATIQVPNDVSYNRTMTYRAVPLRALPGIANLRKDEDLQITGTDGFVTNLPASLVKDTSGKGAVPWLAIEPTDKPWPKTNDGQSIGAFYVVWINPSASHVNSEQWPYRVDSIRAVESRATKWPQIAVGSEVSANSPIRRGQEVVATQCMACHKMNGAGDASIAPDLNLPHGPTEYFKPWALKQYIRDPKSIRSWPDMKMPGFSKDMLSDADLDAVVTYLTYKASKRK
ncbi:c-type cytochrome [Pararobbsia alpina]|uniref:c-type cytochrome n=1 Tax=Pararobbsia alpina TaxID=621374 RepID=UPI0039A489C4